MLKKKIIPITNQIRNMAKETPNLLKTYNRKFARQIQQNINQINKSPFQLIDIYRTTLNPSGWAQQIIKILDKNTNSQYWQVMYWRMRANLQYDNINQEFLNDFILNTIERQLSQNEVVMMSELFMYANNRKMKNVAYSKLIQIMYNIITGQIQNLSKKNFMLICKNIKHNLNINLLQKIAQYIQTNIQQFQVGQLKLMNDFFTHYLFPIQMSNIMYKINSFRIYKILEYINRSIIKYSIKSNFIQKIIPNAITNYEEYLICKYERRPKYEVYEYFEKINGKQQIFDKHLQQVHITNLDEITYLAKFIKGLKYPKAYVKLLEELQKFITDQIPLDSLTYILFQSQKNKIKVDFEKYVNIFEILSKKINQYSNLENTIVHHLFFLLTRYFLYDTRFAKYLQTLDFYYKYKTPRFDRNTSLEIFNSIYLSKEILKLMPHSSRSFMTLFMRPTTKQQTFAYYKAMIIANRIQKGKLHEFNYRYEKKRTTQSFFENQLKQVLNKMPNTFKVQYNVHYMLFQFDMKLAQKNKQLYIDVHGQMHYYINNSDSLMPNSINKRNICNQLINYAIVKGDQKLLYKSQKQQLQNIISAFFNKK